MGLFGKYESLIVTVGLACQLLATVGLWTGPGISEEWFSIGISALGVIGALLCVAAVVPRLRPLTSVGLVAALISGVGWGSWLLVFIRYGPGDPVINITGLLTVPGLIVGVMVLIAGLAPRRPERTYGFLFASLLAASALLLLVVVQFFGDSGAYLPVILAGVVLCAGMVIVAAASTAPRPVRIVAMVAGAVGGIGALLAFIPGILVALLGALVAGVLDVWGRRGEAGASISVSPAVGA